MSSSDSMSFAEKDDVNKEIDVMKKELNFLLNTEVPAVFKDVALQIQMISGFLMGEELKRDTRSERINLVSSSNVEGLKCSLAMHYNELRGIEINFKPTPRHNNYMYKSREDTAWVLYQVTNCCDIIKSLQVNVDTINYKTYEQAVFNVDRLLDSINAARNILLFPKKRNIYELQSQKNMKIFPLVPNDLVFSFYIQGHKLLLAIYVLKGNETQKHILKCETISWLNNVIVLLTNSLNVLQQLKDKLSLFGQIVD